VGFAPRLPARPLAAFWAAAPDRTSSGDLVINDSRKASGDERLKAWPTIANRVAFRAVLMPERIWQEDLQDLEVAERLSQPAQPTRFESEPVGASAG
jgi:hypothetical protein